MRDPAERGARIARLAGLVSLACAGPAAGQWVEPPGSGWAQLTVYHQDTREEFGEDGRVRPFFADGHAVTTSLFLTGAIGLRPGLDAWVQLALHDLEFDDAAGSRGRTGIGDPRVFLRIGPRLLGLPDIPVALRGGVKFPGSDFPVDAEVIPLTEGQRDWELILEFGRSFHPAPLYLQAWLGYRFRERNDGIRRDPGDERFAYLAAGGDVGPLRWKVAGQGLWGDAPTIEGIRVPSAKRKLLELVPTLSWRLGRLVPELGLRVPFEGRNFPAGASLSAGVFTTWTAF